jgi:F0F1-type ATP synthase assembly protein I
MEETARSTLKKLLMILLFIFVLFLVAFSTWQMFHGNLEAAFSSLPFLLIIYLFIMRRRS